MIRQNIAGVVLASGNKVFAACLSVLQGYCCYACSEQTMFKLHTCNRLSQMHRYMWRWKDLLAGGHFDRRDALQRAASLNKSLDDIRAKAIEYVQAKALTHDEMVTGRILK